MASLDSDAEELTRCSHYLVAETGCTDLFMVGSSTGCQDIVRFAQHLQDAPQDIPLRGIVLQAPVGVKSFALHV